MKALVVFHDHGTHILALWLKPGFRHVFCAVQSGNYWISVDARAGVPAIEVAAPGDYDLAEFYRNEGFAVIEIDQGTKAPRLPFAIANCVGMVKAVLSIRSPAITPWGLYNHLRKRHEIPRKDAFLDAETRADPRNAPDPRSRTLA